MRPFRICVVRTCFLLLASLSLPCAVDAQKPAELAERLTAASDASSLDAKGLTPWHLNLAAQLFDGKGAPSEAWTIEEWWQDPDTYRIEYKSPTYTYVELHTAGGRFRTPGKLSPPALIDTLLDQVVRPFPRRDFVSSSLPEFRKQGFGKVQLDCIMLDHMARLNGDAHPRQPSQLPLGLFPTYCFDPGQTSLRVTFDLGSQAVIRNGIGTFQKRSVATNVSVSEGTMKAASAQVVSLKAGEPPPTEIFSNEGALQLVSDATSVPGNVIAGTVLNKTAPVYPQSAKSAHISGTVIIGAIIGRDGKIRSMHLLSTPDGDLALAALIAVRTWTYKPYLLNGEPAEVDTTITVNFNFG